MRKIVLILDFIIVILSFYFFYYNDLPLNYLGWISLSICIYILVTLLPLRREDGISFIFALIYSIAIFGRFILHFTFDFRPLSSYYDSFQHYSNEEIYSAVILGLYSLICLHIGIFLNRLFYKFEIVRRVQDIKPYKEKITNLSLKTTSKFLFLISFLPMVLSYVQGFTGSYGTSIFGNQNIETIINMLSGLMFPSIIIMITLKKSSTSLIFSLIVYLPQLFWGARGRPLLQMFTFIFVYLKVNRVRVKRRYIFTLLITVPLLLNLFIVIKDYRSLDLISWIANFPQIYMETMLTTNSVLEIIYEVGVAIVPTAAVIRLVPKVIPVQYGKTILYSIVAAAPDILGIRPAYISVLSNPPTLVASIEGHAFGSSILQDFYVNYMWLTPFFFILIGYWVQKYSTRIIQEEKITNFVFGVAFIYPLLWWPRSSIGFFFRDIFNTLFIPWLAYILIRNYYKKKLFKHTSFQ